MKKLFASLFILSAIFSINLFFADDALAETDTPQIATTTAKITVSRNFQSQGTITLSHTRAGNFADVTRLALKAVCSEGVTIRSPQPGSKFECGSTMDINLKRIFREDRFSSYNKTLTKQTVTFTYELYTKDGLLSQKSVVVNIPAGKVVPVQTTPSATSSADTVTFSIVKTLPKTYHLTTSIAGSGYVSLARTTADNEIDTVTKKSSFWVEKMVTNETVTLSAVPAATGVKFLGWTGDCSGTEPTCTLKISSNKKVGAKFEYTVKTSVQPVSSATSSSNIDIFSIIDLELGMAHPDVIALQKFLNSNGYTIESVEGQPGSLGNESNYFGQKTKQALLRYQKDKGIYPAWGFFGPQTRRVMGI